MAKTDTPAGVTSQMEGVFQHAGGDNKIDISNTNQYYGTVNNNYANRLSNPQGDKEAILTWLSKITERTVQNQIYRKVAPKTSLWFLENEEYLKWERLESKVKYLWATAMGGAGKTHIFSVVVNHLTKKYIENATLKTGVVYFYCRFSEKHSITILDILSSLLKQLIQQSKQAFSDFTRTIYEPCLRDNTKPLKEDLLEAIERSVTEFDRVFFLLDGVDELPGELAHELVNNLSTLQQPFLITSRDIGHIGNMAPNVKIKVPSIDFKNYVFAQFRNLYKIAPATLDEDSELVKDILRIIEERSDGMFLLIALQVSELKDAITFAELREKLEDLPNSIVDFYEKNLIRIDLLDSKTRSLARKALLFVTHARRPLTTRELREALAIGDGSGAIEDENLVDEGLLLKVSCGLLCIEKDSDTVHLMHYTTKAFFEDKDDEDFKSPNQKIASVCLTYLRHHYIGRRWQNQQEFIEMSLKHPFLSYALCYLGSHAKASPQPLSIPDTPSPEIFPLMRPHLDKRDSDNCDPATLGSSFLRRMRLRMFRDILFSRSSSRSLSLIHSFTLARATYGMKRQISFRDQFSLSFHIDYGHGIHFASLHGILPVVEQLSNHYDTVSRDGRTALHYAVIGGHIHVVEHLLQSDGVDVNHRSKSGHTPLFEACLHNHAGIVQLLLGHPQINPNMRDNDDRPLLDCAIHNSTPEIVEMLIEHHALQLDEREGLTVLSSAFTLVLDAFVDHLNLSQDNAASQLITAQIEESLPKDTRSTSSLDLAGDIATPSGRRSFIQNFQSSMGIDVGPKGSVAPRVTESSLTPSALDLAPSSIRRSVTQQLHSWMGIDVGPQNQQWSPPQVDGHERQMTIFTLVLRAFGIDKDPLATVTRMLNSLEDIKSELIMRRME